MVTSCGCRFPGNSLDSAFDGESLPIVSEKWSIATLIVHAHLYRMVEGQVAGLEFSGTFVLVSIQV
jgi:hypothetical protein